MKYIILVLWTFSLFLLMFSSFPFRVECRPTRAMGPRPMGLTSQQLTSINYNQNLLPSCPVLEGPSAARFNPWPELYRPDITAKVWESPIVLEGTARSRSEVRPDGTFGVTFDLDRVVKGDAPLLRRRKQFRLQFLDNPLPPLEEKNNNRDMSKNNRNNNATSPNKPRINNSLNNLNNNFNSNNYNSHSRNFASSSVSSLSSGSSSSSSSSSSTNSNNGIISSRQLHQPQNQLTLYQQQQQQSRQHQQSQSRQGQQSPNRQGQQQQSQSRQVLQSQSRPQQTQSRQVQLQSRQMSQTPRQQQTSQSLQSNPNVRTFRNSSLPSAVQQPYNTHMNNNMNSRNVAGTRRAPSRNGRNAPNVFNPRSSTTSSVVSMNSNSNKCLPPRATIKTGRKYYVFAAKVDNHFIAVFSPELANKRSTKQMDSILCKGCGQAPSVVAAKDVQLKVKERLRLRCRLKAGNPLPVLTWYKDGRPVNLTDTRFRLRPKRRQSILVIRKAKAEDVGTFTCKASNGFGSAHANVRVSLPSSSPSKPLSSSHKPSSSKPVGTTPTTLWPLASSECPFDSYCLNGGTCSYYETIGEYVCQCAEGYKGQRCDTKDIPTSGSMYLSYFCIFGTNNPDYPC